MSYIDKYEIVKELIGQDPFLFALERYGGEIANVLNGIVSDDIKETLKTCSYNKDRRSIEDFASDVILSSWIIEDFMVDKLKRQGHKVELNGTDKNRRFTTSNNIRCDSDLKIDEKPVEVMVCFTDFWKKNKYLHLRDNKFWRLKKERAYLLAIDIPSKKYSLISINNIHDFKEVFNRAWSKQAIEVPLRIDSFIALNNKNMFHILQ